MPIDIENLTVNGTYKSYPNDWKIVELGDLLKKIRIPVEVIPDQDYQQIGIRSHGKGLFYKELVRGSDLGNKSVFWVQEDCLIINIVFAWEHAVAITTSKEKGMIASHRFPMWQAKEEVDLKYLYNFLLMPFGRHLLELASPGGAGRNKTLGQDEFHRITVCIPRTIEEQQKIIKILKTWDKAIELKEKFINEKKILRRWLIRSLLTGQKRLPGFAKKWQLVRLGDVCKIVSGGTPDTDVNDFWGGEIPWCTPIDIASSGKYINKTRQNISIKGVKNSSTSVLPAGSVLMCSRATIGPRSIAKCDITTNQGFKSFVCSDLIDNEYLYYYIEVLIPLFIKKANGSTFNELSKSDVVKIVFPLPQMSEQIAIAEILSCVDREINLYEQHLKELKKTKKALMKMLLTGMIRV